MKELYPDQHEVIERRRKAWGVSYALALPAYLLGIEPFCVNCGEPTRLRNTFRLMSTCSTECDYALRKRKVVKSRAQNIKQQLAGLLANGLPLSNQVLKLIKASCAGASDSWYVHVLKVKPALRASFFQAGAPKWNVDHFGYFLANGRVKRCVDCNDPLVSPRAARCVSKCASVYGAQQAHVTLKQRYGGVGYAVSEFAQAAQTTMSDRYGSAYTGSSQVLLAKVQNTTLENHGVKFPMQLARNKRALSVRYKDSNFVKKARQSYERTMCAKYGQDWGALMTEAMSQVRYKLKEVRLGDRTVHVQGYEPFVLHELMARGCKAKDIVVYPGGYNYKHPTKRKMARYKPDIAVPKYKLIIEVKSVYTAGLGKAKNAKDYWRVLRAKSRGVADTGDQLLLIVVDPSKGMFRLRDPHLYTQSKARKLLRYESFTRTK